MKWQRVPPASHSSSKKFYLLAPARNGAQAAGAWRFWWQNAEFYAASRSTLAISQDKCSFHSRGGWRARIGQKEEKLGPTRISDDWVQALSLRWLLWSEALQPPRNEQANLIEVPEEHQLSAHLLVTGKGSKLMPEIMDNWGAELWRAQLKDERWLLLQSQVARQAAEDKKQIVGWRRAVEPIERPPGGASYAEMSFFTPHSESGDFVTIIPFGRESFG